MTSRMFSHEQRQKLIQIVNEGVSISQEIEDLSAGLNDTIKAVAEELELKPSLLKKAIKIAQKGKYADTNAAHEELIDILDAAGKNT